MPVTYRTTFPKLFLRAHATISYVIQFADCLRRPVSKRRFSTATTPRRRTLCVVVGDYNNNDDDDVVVSRRLANDGNRRRTIGRQMVSAAAAASSCSISPCAGLLRSLRRVPASSLSQCHCPSASADVTAQRRRQRRQDDQRRPAGPARIGRLTTGRPLRSPARRSGSPSRRSAVAPQFRPEPVTLD